MLSFSKLELQRSGQIEFDEMLSFAPEVFLQDSRIDSLQEVRVKGKGYYQPQPELLAVTAEISGMMIVPDARTLEALEYPFSTLWSATYSFIKDDDEETIKVKGDSVDLKPEIFRCIMSEVPIRVTTAEVISKQGENWQVLTEAEYLAERKDAIDPRLQKLKEFKFDDEEE